MKPILFLLAIAGVCTVNMAQDIFRRDSLLRIAHDPGAHDTARVWAFMETGKLYLDTHADSAAMYIQQALGLAESLGFKRGIARCRINKAVAIYNMGRLDSVLALCHSAIPLCEEMKMGKELVAIYNMLGNTWNLKGNTWMAVGYFEKCLEAMKTAEVPPRFPVVVNNNIAIIYNNLKLYEKAIEYASGSLRLAEEMGDEITAGIASQHLGLATKGLNRRKEAIAHFEKSVAIGRKHGLAKLLATALSNLAEMHAEAGDYKTATALYEEGLQVARENEDPEGMVYNLHGLSLMALGDKKFDKSERTLRDALKLADEIQLSSYLPSLNLTLSDLALAQGEMDRYLHYRSAYIAGRDSLASNALVHAVQELETKYETEKKEQRILSLEQEKELQQLRIRQKNGLIAALGAGAASLVLLAFLLWKVMQNRRKIHWQETRIQQQKIRELEQERQIGFAGAVLQGQETERSRLARDLHDGLGGMLSGIRQGLVGAAEENPAIGRAIGDLDRSITELRHIARNMMPEALLRFGLKDALEDFCDHLRQSGGLHIHFQAFGMEERLPGQTEIVVFRIAQELLNNVVRHAQASTVLLQLLRDGKRFSLTVEDDGRGFDSRDIGNAQGIGWVNIRSRVNYLGGSLDVRSAPGEGCSVHIETVLP